MQISKARHPKIYVVLGKMNNEDSRGIKRLHKEMNYVPNFQDILHRSKHLKRQREQTFQHNTHSQAPRVGRKDPRRMERGAWHARHMCLAHGYWWYVPVTCGSSHCFVPFFIKKACDFSPISGGEFPYKYRLPHSLFLVQNCSNSRGKRILGAFMRSLSLLSKFF